MKAHLNGYPIEKVFIDNEAIVNILPSKVLKTLGKKEEDLISTNITVGNFTGGSSPTKGVISIQLQIGTRVTNTTFLVVDTHSSYVLLRRDWIQVNGCVPFSLHQAVIFLTKGRNNEMEIAWADDNPFKADTNNIEANLYSGKLESVEVMEQTPPLKKDYESLT